MERTYIAARVGPRFYTQGPFQQSTAEQIGLWRKCMEAEYRWELNPHNEILMMESAVAFTEYHQSIWPIAQSLTKTFHFFSIFKLAIEQHLARKG